MRARILTLFCITIILMAVPANAEDGYESPDLIHGVPSPQSVDTATRTNVVTRLLQTPLHFIANQGQMDESVFYYAKSDGATVYCTDQGITFGFTEGSVSLKFSEDRRVRPEARFELPGKVNYFIGSDPASWQANVPTFGEIVYPSVYPGIDLVYSGDQRRLKYTFYVQPGADPRQIQMMYEGVQDVRVDNATGELVIKTEWCEIRDIAPIAYQEIDGVRQNVKMQFRVENGNGVGFVIGDYDGTHTLVLDPTYSTYLGGDDRDWGTGIAVDSSGNAYVTGTTASTGFPIQDAFQSSNNFDDVFVTKLFQDGSLAYSTYLGGDEGERGAGIAVDSLGSAYVTGFTYSYTDFPIKNAFQSNHGGGGMDAFVTKLSTDGSLVFSTFLGGNGHDRGYGIAVDSLGSVYVTGNTPSTTGFPIQNAFQSIYNGGNADAFVTKLSTDGSLAYSTYLGGDGDDGGRSIAADSSGNAYVAGATRSISDFPIQNAFQVSNNGFLDAFVTKLSPDGSLVYSTYLGGDRDDQGCGIAVDSSGNVYVTGFTYPTTDTDFPIQNAFQSSYGGGYYDAFVTKLFQDGSLAYSTYLGGDDSDFGFGIAVGNSGSAYVTGYTWSNDFPIKNAFQSTRYGGTSVIDAFVTKLSSEGLLTYSTYLGGGGEDRGNGIAVDNSGNAYVTGQTRGSGFPIESAFQSGYGGSSYDAFVTKLSENGQLLECFVKLQQALEPVSSVDVGEFFDICMGETTGDIAQVRFSSDDLQDGNPTGTWTQWYDWDTSAGDWHAIDKTKAWSFATYGAKEVWAEAKYSNGSTIQCHADILVAGEFTFAHITDVHIGLFPTFKELFLSRIAEWGSSREYRELVTSTVDFIETLVHIGESDPKPAFLLVTGDNVDFNRKSYLHIFKELLNDFTIKYDIPVYIVPGNHDRFDSSWFTSFVSSQEIESNSKYYQMLACLTTLMPACNPLTIEECFEAALLSCKSMPWLYDYLYEKEHIGNDHLENYYDVIERPDNRHPGIVSLLDGFGDYSSPHIKEQVNGEQVFITDQGRDHYNYYFEHKGYLFMGLDSGADTELEFADLKDEGPEGGGLHQHHLDALRLLDKYKPKIVFMHHPIVTGKTDGPYEDASIIGIPPTVDMRNDLIQYCGEYNVKMALTGHTHRDYIFDTNGNQLESLSEAPAPWFIQTRSATKHEHGYRLVTIDGDQMDTEVVVPEPRDRTIITLKHYGPSWLPVWVPTEMSLESPVLLYVMDSLGRRIGGPSGGGSGADGFAPTDHVNISNMTGDIPDSYYTGYYDPSAPQVILFGTDDDYRFQVVGTEEGSYVMDITSTEGNGETTSFTATDIPIADEAVHQYTVDWETLSQGGEGVTIQIDSDGDGSFEETITTGPTYGSTSIPLAEGWNLFSFSVNKCFYEGTPPDNQPACVELVDVINDLGFVSLADWFEFVITPVNPMDNPWSLVIGTEGVMDSSLPPSSHSLKYMSVCSGYWVKIKDTSGGATMSLSGPLFDPGCAIPMQDGWSMVSYPLSTGYHDTDDPPAEVTGVTNWVKVPAPVGAYVFASIAGKYHIIISTHGVYDPSLPASSSSLHYIAPGDAFWIKMNEPWDMLYANMGTAITSLALTAPSMNQTITGSDVTPSNALAVVYGSITQDGVEADVGNHVQVYTQSGVLCGESTATHRGQYGMMLIYGDDVLTQEIEGAQPGEKMAFYVNNVPAQTEGDVYWLGDKSIQCVNLTYQSRPQESMLAQNYPNPFNPETWIPYQLREDAHVEIKIYTSTGQLVRTLNLGRKSSGFYTSKEKAAYWDGRNESGEHVASGIYFYGIKAGDFAATHKMVMKK